MNFTGNLAAKLKHLLNDFFSRIEVLNPGHARWDEWRGITGAFRDGSRIEYD